MHKKTTLILSAGLVAAVTMSGCGSLTKQCTSSSPKKDVKITYGDSHLSVDVKEKMVKKDDYLVFKLKPDSEKGPKGEDYSNKTVTVEGKNTAASWISASGTDAGTGGELIVCVPTDVEFDTYYYLIDVEDVGELDPRVAVEP